MIVRATHFVTLTVSKLYLYHVTPVLSALIEQGRSHTPKAMNGHFIFVVAEAAQGVQKPLSDMQRVAEKGEGNTSSPCPVHSFSSVNSVTTWPDMGTVWVTFIFMRPVGIPHTALSKSISSYIAPRISWERTKT